MTKFNFTEEQLRQARQVADLMATLNKVGDGSYGKSTEGVEEFIKAVNGIEDKVEYKGIKINIHAGESIISPSLDCRNTATKGAEVSNGDFKVCDDGKKLTVCADKKIIDSLVNKTKSELNTI